MKCTACGLAQKREGTREGEKSEREKVGGEFPFFLSQISSSFSSLPSPLDACHAGQFLRVTKGQIHDADSEKTTNENAKAREKN